MIRAVPMSCSSLSLFILTTSLVYLFHLPLQDQSEFEGVDVVNLLDLNDVDHRHRNIDIHLDDHDDLDDVDKYIMVKCLSVCLSVTKNDHFLLGVSCNHLNHP